MKDKETGVEVDLNEVNPDEIIYRIDVPANRYDILCIEGLTRALLVFLGKIKPPVYKAVDAPEGQVQHLYVKPEVPMGGGGGDENVFVLSFFLQPFCCRRARSVRLSSRPCCETSPLPSSRTSRSSIFRKNCTRTCAASVRSLPLARTTSTRSRDRSPTKLFGPRTSSLSHSTRRPK